MGANMAEAVIIATVVEPWAIFRTHETINPRNNSVRPVND
jgi:hypothetical protein